MSRYAKSRNGLVHLINEVNPEYTLCGDAFDIDAVDASDEEHAWEDSEKGPVTCRECARVIESCRGVRIKL